MSVRLKLWIWPREDAGRSYIVALRSGIENHWTAIWNEVVAAELRRLETRF